MKSSLFNLDGGSANAVSFYTATGAGAGYVFAYITYQN